MTIHGTEADKDAYMTPCECDPRCPTLICPECGHQMAECQAIYDEDESGMYCADCSFFEEGGNRGDV